MKVLKYTMFHNLSKLTTDLFSVFPRWRILRLDGTYKTDVQISGNGELLVLKVPKNTDESILKSVLSAHTLTPLPKQEDPYLLLKKELEVAVSVLEVTKALINWLTRIDIK